MYIFEILPRIFNDDLMFYQGFALIILIILTILFYKLVYELTESRGISFIAALLFSINYGSTFEMIAIGSYQFFIQRVIYFILLFPSFIYIVKYLKTRQNSYFFFSLGFYTIAVFLAQFSLFFLPFLPAYFLGLLISKQINGRIFFVVLLRFSSFAAITILLLYISILFDNTTYLKDKNLFTYFTQNTEEIGYSMLRQLTILTIPLNLMQFIANYFKTSISHTTSYFILPTLLTYTFLTRYLWRKEKELRVPIITSILFLPMVFSLNMFMRSELIMDLEYGSRYLYVPSIGLAIFWAIFLYSLFKKKFFKPLVVIFLVWWIVTQTNTIWKEIDKDYYKHVASKKSLAYIKKIFPSLQDDAIVITPSVLGYWASDFAKTFYGKKNITFTYMDGPWDTWVKEYKFPRKFDPKKDRILYYDYNTEKVIDKTGEYKNIMMKNKAYR